MPKQKSPAKRKIVIYRDVEISAVNAFVSMQARQERGLEEARIDQTATLVFSATMKNPVRDVHELLIRVGARDEALAEPGQPPWIGLITEFRPRMDGFVHIAHQDFDRLAVLAGAGLLKHARIAFTEPYRRESFVTALSFSTEPDE